MTGTIVNISSRGTVVTVTLDVGQGLRDVRFDRRAFMHMLEAEPGESILGRAITVQED